MELFRSHRVGGQEKIRRVRFMQHGGTYSGNILTIYILVFCPFILMLVKSTCDSKSTRQQMEASSGSDIRPAKKQRVEVEKHFLLTLTSKADLVEHLKQYEIDEKHLKEIGDAVHVLRCDIYGQPVKEVAELSRDQLDLRQAARLALVACAAQKSGVRVTSTLSELMEEKRQLDHNAVYLEQAAEGGMFIINSFVFHVVTRRWIKLLMQLWLFSAATRYCSSTAIHPCQGLLVDMFSARSCGQERTISGRVPRTSNS